MSEPQAKASQKDSKRYRLEVLRGQLELERSTFMSTWRDTGEHVFPRRMRFSITDVNRGDRRNQKIIDSTATLAARTLRAGMMGGVTSPARPWFRLTTADYRMADVGSVKEWLHSVTETMESIFLKSNLYNVLPIIYGDIGTFATGAISIEEDSEDVVRFYAFPIGSYMISNNAKLKVDTFFRTFRLTIRQVVEKFLTNDDGSYDWSKASPWIKNEWDLGRMESWVDIAHCIQPNCDYDKNKEESKFKKYESTYYEYAGAGDQTKYQDIETLLSEKGFDYFPILCPRWEISGEDAYGTSCPGMDALGDIRQLQLGEKKIMQAIEKMVNPPMVGPSSLRTAKASIIPGDITFLDVREGQQGFKPAHEVNPKIQELSMKQEEVRMRIKRCFFEDLFLMLAASDRRQITAREVDERHEEKLLALGPVLEQLNQDLLDPLIDATFDIMLKRNLVPPPPQELQGMDLKVEYISVMAQAQKLIGIQAVERLAQFVYNGAQVAPDIIDNIDIDELVDTYADMLGTPPAIIRDSDAVKAIRTQKQKAQQEAQRAQQAEQVSKSAKNLSDSDTGGQNALTQLLEQSKAGQLTPN